jgi:two-component system response regulator NreC
MLLDGIGSWLGTHADVRVVGRVTSVASLAASIAELKPDVVTLELEWPEIDAIEVVSVLKAKHPTLKVVVCTGSADAALHSRALAAGASKVIHKSESAEALLRAIRGRAVVAATQPGELQPARGREPQRSSVADWAGSNVQVTVSDQDLLSRLTPREVEVLRLIGEGHSRLAIAEAIFRSPKTVDAHRGSIMDKLGMRDRALLVRFAIRVGLVHP